MQQIILILTLATMLSIPTSICLSAEKEGVCKNHGGEKQTDCVSLDGGKTQTCQTTCNDGTKVAGK